MSGGAVFRETLRAIQELSLPAVAQEDVVAALRAGRPGPLDLLYEAGHDAGLEDDILLRRAAAIYIVFCAGNLADDLVDGDCHYLEPPFRRGPGTQHLMQSAFLWAALRAGIPPAALEVAARELARSAAHHQSEVRVVRWTADEYLTIADGIAGRQNEAYFNLLWADTPLQPLAAKVALPLAVGAMVVSDIQSKDSRFWSMDAEDRSKIVSRAREQLEPLRELGLRFLGLALPKIDAGLQL